MHSTIEKLKVTDFPAIKRGKLETLQVNFGYLCNLSCLHCHVNAGPTRKELMDKKTIDDVLLFIDQNGIKTLDLTGGAPEMNPHFEYIVSEAVKRGVAVIDRCNLTILEEPGYEQMAEFMAAKGVQIVASLPCYSSDNVDAQRGDGVFDKSISALQELNTLGYGKGLQLDLVYNPQGPQLPPNQAALELEYKTHLRDNFGIEFSRLLTITNMPIKRFGSALISKGQFETYMDLLKSAYQSVNLDGLMCKSILSVDWKGFVYDCDFNQMLELPAGFSDTKKHISDCLGVNFHQQPITIADHCYGCTAGSGSSCAGSLS
ncbi:MAG: radical SAM protein [Cycloclasticus sp. symbiont of Poecilosclerida sp. M]|nr:MAG: radical SAM protein [Cycloclasticus sp. symbiont of Poecilosclerida sp. M]